MWKKRRNQVFLERKWHNLWHNPQHKWNKCEKYGGNGEKVEKSRSKLIKNCRKDVIISAFVSHQTQTDSNFSAKQTDSKLSHIMLLNWIQVILLAPIVTG